MNEDIEDLKAVVDQLLIQQAIDSMHIRVLTHSLLNLAEGTLDPSVAKTFVQTHYQSLVDQSNELSDLPEMVFQRKKAIQALFDLNESLYDNLRETDE